MRLYKLHDHDSSIFTRSGSSKRDVKVHIDSDDDDQSDDDDKLCHECHDNSWSDTTSNDSAFSKGQFFDLSIKLPKFSAFKVVVLSFLIVYTLVSSCEKISFKN